MSVALVCGKRSAAIFERQSLPSSCSSRLSKRLRCSSSSPHRFSLIHHLTAFFPDMDNQLLEKALEECGNDLDSAIRSLNDLRLGGSVQKSLDFADIGSDAAVDLNAQLQPEGEGKCDAEVAASDDPVAGQNYPINGAEWVELFVKEMVNASNMDDAKERASRAVGVMEKSICERASAETEMNFHQENMKLKEKVKALSQENIILKRAVCIQNERLKEYEDRKEESKHLKQLVSQYQERLRTLEINNYALTMHVKQAEQSSSMIPGRFHPDVF